METVEVKSEEIPTWIYGVVGGTVAAVAVVGTTFLAWRHRRKKKMEDKRINESLHQEDVQNEIDSLRASTPRD